MAISELVIGGALATAAVVPPSASTPTSTFVSMASLLTGPRAKRDRTARSERRNPSRRSGVSTTRNDTAAAVTDSTRAVQPAQTGTRAS
ncbi:hypothetical protein ACTJJ4_07290 [Microbacterium sp. 22195]|uniref:hypothetical protein n=1 Tax=Microbacterium sp. 22195 TaxID=3453891 RepID=UPI003F87576E